MRYLTKEWYNNMQRMFMPELVIDERAKDFSEEYFEETYILEEEKWLLQSSDIYPFKIYYEAILKKLQEELPNSILKKVGDIRLLALKHVTAEMYDEIKAYYTKNGEKVNKAMQDYYEETKRMFKNNLPKFAAENFHDCTITDFKKHQNDYLITLDNENTFTNVNNLIFKNAEVIKQEGIAKNGSWLYDEIYKIDNKYEVHILFWDDDLKYLIIKCEDIILE